MSSPLIRRLDVRRGVPARIAVFRPIAAPFPGEVTFTFFGLTTEVEVDIENTSARVISPITVTNASKGVKVKVLKIYAVFIASAARPTGPALIAVVPTRSAVLAITTATLGDIYSYLPGGKYLMKWLANTTLTGLGVEGHIATARVVAVVHYPRKIGVNAAFALVGAILHVW